MNIGVRHFRLKLRNLGIFSRRNLLSDFDYVPVYFVGKNFKPKHPICMRADASEVYLECPHSWGYTSERKSADKKYFVLLGIFNFPFWESQHRNIDSIPKELLWPFVSIYWFVLFVETKNSVWNLLLSHWSGARTKYLSQSRCITFL